MLRCQNFISVVILCLSALKCEDWLCLCDPTSLYLSLHLTPLRSKMGQSQAPQRQASQPASQPAPGYPPPLPPPVGWVEGSVSTGFIQNWLETCLSSSLWREGNRHWDRSSANIPNTGIPFRCVPITRVRRMYSSCTHLDNQDSLPVLTNVVLFCKKMALLTRESLSCAVLTNK